MSKIVFYNQKSIIYKHNYKKSKSMIHRVGVMKNRNIWFLGMIWKVNLNKEEKVLLEKIYIMRYTVR